MYAESEYDIEFCADRIFDIETGYFRGHYDFYAFWQQKYYFALNIMENENFTMPFHKSEILKPKSVIFVFSIFWI